MPRRSKSKTEHKDTKENQDKTMSLTEHLRELRNRVLICVILLVGAVLLGLQVAPGIVKLLMEMGEKYSYHFVYLSPQELLLQYFSVSLIFAVCVTLPVTGYQIWAFVRPGLKKNENLFFMLALIFGLICFCIGVWFAYKVMLPFMLYFLISLSEGSGVEASISVQNYVSFLMTIFVLFGAVFELPVLSVLLTQMGLLKVQWMKKGRKVMIVVIFFVAALITPPDVISQIMVAVPMMALYELSIVLCLLFQRMKHQG
jgi:sec-independent protein translocase protein TatC